MGCNNGAVGAICCGARTSPATSVILHAGLSGSLTFPRAAGFGLAKWMDDYETSAKYNIAETCCAPVSVDDLCELSNDKSKNPLGVVSRKLTYGSIRGSEQLRDTLANLYSAKTTSPLPRDNILITAGAIAANYLLLYTLIGPEDHVICHYPTYQQLYSVPASLGAKVSLWKSSEANEWKLDLNELRALIQPNTKLIILK